MNERMFESEYLSKHAAVLRVRCAVCGKNASLRSTVVVAEVGYAHVSSGDEAAVGANGHVDIGDDIAGIVESG